MRLSYRVRLCAEPLLGGWKSFVLTDDEWGRLACSFMCKNTNIRGYPAYEITLLFLYAYGSYALAEVMQLSGIMSLFFCGITMAHYNSYNLSKPSQVTAEHIFKSFALVSEFFVFLYMGMGVCAGQFGRWDFTFVLLAIIFCLIARVFNTFPLSWVANLGCVGTL